ncbi:MAG: PH domain-containing protein [Aliiglaciecola sp.]|uniref:PH domain-containing protein n=1 Tax=Aliiglaciecola sp. TaxID=1872441 RepID=UPI003298A2BB
MTYQVLETSALPDPLEIDFEPLNIRYRPMAISTIWMFSIVFMLIMTLTRWQPFIALPTDLLAAYPLAVGVVLFISILISLYLYIAIPCKQYCLTETNLHFACGVIFRRIYSQPILRIQHVELKRGPIERAFKLASLQVFSAGGSIHTFEIPGLSLHDAQKIRQFILDHKGVRTNG